MLRIHPCGVEMALYFYVVDGGFIPIEAPATIPLKFLNLHSSKPVCRTAIYPNPLPLIFPVTRMSSRYMRCLSRCCSGCTKGRNPVRSRQLLPRKAHQTGYSEPTFNKMVEWNSYLVRGFSYSASSTMSSIILGQSSSQHSLMAIFISRCLIRTLKIQIIFFDGNIKDNPNSRLAGGSIV